ncbi:Gfo/Idh/MocA family oxidoreductase [Paenibacillus rhizovicinus]|uniref:Gfo/Idh/MocA family oxidoreductase n=1 Tax=Paenibacillus rhizovicinus TaxID=2704463 RepID=A0A6C0NW40_9BACL|nr:Gfo/Idh/MocA family oxidoreductase [Paenibacillus rhizovicinus]QHW29943.1 Gfo/Idh/MocA family oxidoreductase [Paenibacillus rhizovicinus]
MEKQIRVGIIGLGGMGRAHAKHLRSLSGVEITAVCGQSMEKAEAFNAEHAGGTAAAYDRYEDMLEQETLDAVYVCIPPYAHRGQVEAAAKRGCAVFVEKPIALDSETAASMVLAVEQAGVLSQVGYHNRFGSAVRELKRMIDDGTAGVPTLFDGRYDCNSLHSPWWRDRSLSGGQVFEQAIHTYDLAMHLFGTPTRVSGLTGNLAHREISDYTVEDTSAAIVRFESGAMASICASNCAVPMEWNSSFTVVCSKATVYFMGPNKAEFVLTGGAEPVRRLFEEEVDVYLEENIAFIAALRGEGPELCPIGDGLASLRLVEKVMQSAELDGTMLQFE